jgi:hypothetical protein
LPQAGIIWAQKTNFLSASREVVKFLNCTDDEITGIEVKDED